MPYPNKKDRKAPEIIVTCRVPMVRPPLTLSNELTQEWLLNNVEEHTT